MLIYDNEPALIEWAASIIGCSFRPDARAVGWGRPLRAVVVYDGFSECDCNMHIASDQSRRWITRGFIRAAFSYPFIQLGLRRVTGLVPASNMTALNFDRKLGFEYEGRCRDALPNDDIIILGMRKTCCPWIPEAYRHARPTPADH